LETPADSSGVETIPLLASTCFARLDALNSVGSVTSWKSTTAPKSAMPAQIIPVDPMSRPRKKRIAHARLPSCVTGTRCDRIFSGPYARASWIAWPASWAATATADTDLPVNTPGESRSAFARGS